MTVLGCLSGYHFFATNLPAGRGSPSVRYWHIMAYENYSLKLFWLPIHDESVRVISTKSGLKQLLILWWSFSANNIEHISHYFRKFIFFAFVFNPLYSYKSEAHCMNVRRIVGSKAGNPDLDIPKFGVMKWSKFVGIVLIVENVCIFRVKFWIKYKWYL